MMCMECGGTFVEKSGPCSLKGSIPNFVVDLPAYEECDACGEILLPPGACGVIAARRDEIYEARGTGT